MASVLKWKTLKVAPGKSVRISVTGNVATRVVTRFFWLPVSDDTVDTKWDRDDGQVLEFDPSLIKVGQQNHLGFACRAAPLEASDATVFFTFQVRQDNAVLEEATYSLDVSDPNTPVRLSDGITLTQ